MGTLTSLEVLEFNENPQMTGIPDTIVQLSNLRGMNCVELVNKINGISAGLF